MTILSPARVLFGLAALGLILVATWHDLIDLAARLGSQDWIMSVAEQTGPWVLVLFLALAVIISPIPSGPIAMGAGALYGTMQGGILVILGSFLGAMLAFAITRIYGRKVLATSRHSAAQWVCRPRSQNALMLLVFASRLVPFIFFDAVSYLAGLTALSAWRFAIATGLGIVPLGFAFAAMGAGLVEGGQSTVLALIACGVTLIVPAILWLRTRFAKGLFRRAPHA